VGAAAKTIYTIKSVDPSIIVIVGGSYPSIVSPEELFEDLVGADFAFRGEAKVYVGLCSHRYRQGAKAEDNEADEKGRVCNSKSGCRDSIRQNEKVNQKKTR